MHQEEQGPNKGNYLISAVGKLHLMVRNQFITKHWRNLQTTLPHAVFVVEAILPCYGLAEATLLVAGGPKGRIPVIQNLVNSGLERNQVLITAEKNTGTRTLVSCGKSIR